MIDESFDKLRLYGLRSAQEIKQNIEQNLTKIILTRKGLELCSLDASRNAFFDKESKCAEMRSKFFQEIYEIREIRGEFFDSENDENDESNENIL